MKIVLILLLLLTGCAQIPRYPNLLSIGYYPPQQDPHGVTFRPDPEGWGYWNDDLMIEIGLAFDDDGGRATFPSAIIVYRRPLE